MKRRRDDRSPCEGSGDSSCMSVQFVFGYAHVMTWSFTPAPPPQQCNVAVPQVIMDLIVRPSTSPATSAWGLVEWWPCCMLWPCLAFLALSLRAAGQFAGRWARQYKDQRTSVTRSPTTASPLPRRRNEPRVQTSANSCSITSAHHLTRPRRRSSPRRATNGISQSSSDMPSRFAETPRRRASNNHNSIPPQGEINNSVESTTAGATTDGSNRLRMDPIVRRMLERARPVPSEMDTNQRFWTEGQLRDAEQGTL